MKSRTRIMIGIPLLFLVPAILLGAEGRIPISGPTTITAAGAYILTENLVTTGSALNAVKIAADDVNLDLNGHTIEHNGTGPVIDASGHTRIVIENGYIRNNTSTYSIFMDNTTPGTGGEITIRRITFTGASSSNGSVHIKGTTFSNCTSDSQRLKAAVTDNQFHYVGPYPIWLECGHASIIARNIVTYAGDRGITLRKVVDSAIKENVVAWSQTTGGIRIDTSENILVIRNVVRKNKRRGIYLLASSGVTVRENIVSGNGSAGNFSGIVSDAASSLNVIDWNVAMSNTHYGISVKGSALQSTVVSHNRARNNGTGDYQGLGTAALDGGDNY